MSAPWTAEELAAEDSRTQALAEARAAVLRVLGCHCEACVEAELARREAGE